MHIDCLEHKPGKFMLPASDKRALRHILIICQLHSFVMGERHVLNKLVLKQSICRGLGASYTLAIRVKW